MQIKKEIEEVEEREAPKMDDFDLSNNEEFMEEPVAETQAEKIEFKVGFYFYYVVCVDWICN